MRSAPADTDGMMRLHRRYHFALYQLTESTWLPYLIELLWLHAERYQRMALLSRTADADQEHRSILDALGQGDSETASELLRAHLMGSTR